MYWTLIVNFQDHSRFVQAVRYSPDGEMFASAGFDGKVFLYTGKDSELIGEIGSPAHSGGVYRVSNPTTCDLRHPSSLE